jgi:hypothetical protein
MERLGLARYLDFVLDSGEVGVEKPDPRIFARALAEAGLRPSEAVYVGDFYSIDVVGARAAGMDTVLLDGGGARGGNGRGPPRPRALLGRARLPRGDERAGGRAPDRGRGRWSPGNDHGPPSQRLKRPRSGGSMTSRMRRQRQAGSVMNGYRRSAS